VGTEIQALFLDPCIVLSRLGVEAARSASENATVVKSVMKKKGSWASSLRIARISKIDTPELPGTTCPNKHCMTDANLPKCGNYLFVAENKRVVCPRLELP
jgi:hypothetical protein